MKIESTRLILSLVTHFDVLVVLVDALELIEDVLRNVGGLITLMGLSKNIITHLNFLSTTCGISNNKFLKSHFTTTVCACNALKQ
jgi:hypothetical protein